MKNNKIGKVTTYLDTNESIERRVEDLISVMTIDEKISQLGSVWGFELLDGMKFEPRKARKLIANGIGQITRIGGASNLGTVDLAKTTNEIQRFLTEETRLGIPAIVHEECCSGYMAKGATCFPQIIGVASTWEPELVEKMSSVIKTQMRAVGAHQGLAPVLDVARDPRWGRTEETFGEDPYLVARMGVAYVKGLQGNDLKNMVMATSKHFLTYSSTEGGLNCAPSHVSERELREIFLFPVRAAIKEAKLACIMPAYNELDGVPMHSSKELLTELVRKELGFDGIIVSDYSGVELLFSYHSVARDKEEAAIMALEAGVDVELPTTDCYGSFLKNALTKGLIKESLINDAVSRILRMKFLLGLFEDPYVKTKDIVELFDNADQRNLAYRIAQKSVVLMKNEHEILPLSKDIGSIAVIGPNADSIRNLVGDYSYVAHVENLIESKEKQIEDLSNVFRMGTSLAESSTPMISIYEAIKNKVSPRTRISYARGCDVIDGSRNGFKEAVEIAQQSDIAIVIVGDKSGLTKSCTSGETRDHADIDLPGVQNDLVRTIYETGTPVVVVLINGRPYSISWIADHIPAILDAWLPGEEGAAAVADVLFGDFNPCGKLPMSFPRSAGQIPIYYYHKPSGGRTFWHNDYVSLSSKPLFPFGHGLSYTKFEFSNLKISPAKVRSGQELGISLDIKNVGKIKGDEVIQLYLSGPLSKVTRPVKELKGFKRVTLEPGEKKNVKFILAVNQLGFYSRNMTFVVEPGIVKVMLGGSSEDIRLTGEFRISGEVVEINDVRDFFSRTVL